MFEAMIKIFNGIGYYKSSYSLVQYAKTKKSNKSLQDSIMKLL